VTPSRRRAGYQSVFAFLALLCGCGSKAEYPAAVHPDQVVPAEPPPVIEAEEAALYIGHPDVSFIDARPEKAYRKGHAPGAVHLEWTEFRDATVLMSGKLDADEARLAEVFASRGVGSDSWAIVFGDPLTLWGEEGRIAWTLAYLGATRVSIVDGGHAAWVAAGLPVQKGAVTRARREFVPTLQDQVLARKQDVAVYVDERGDDVWRTVLLDVREPGEFRGAQDAPTYGALRRGHLPTAVNIPWRTLLDENGRIKPREELGEILIAKGVRPDAHVVTYCTGGVRSAHTWFVLTMLGYPNVANYAGSWWEWSLDRKLPVETGPERDRPWTPPWPPGSKADDDDSGDDDDSAEAIHRAGRSGAEDPKELLDALKQRLDRKSRHAPEGAESEAGSKAEPKAEAKAAEAQEAEAKEAEAKEAEANEAEAEEGAESKEGAEAEEGAESKEGAEAEEAP